MDASIIEALSSTKNGAGERELTEAMGEAVASGGPTLIEVPVDPDELPYPARAADVLKDKKPTVT